MAELILGPFCKAALWRVTSNYPSTCVGDVLCTFAVRCGRQRTTSITLSQINILSFVVDVVVVVVEQEEKEEEAVLCLM